MILYANDDYRLTRDHTGYYIKRQSDGLVVCRHDFPAEHGPRDRWRTFENAYRELERMERGR